jgi:probable HAF family extracellular repeat protein
MSRITRMAFLLTSLASIPASVEGSGIYTITDLGTLPGTVQSVATGINNSGQIIGFTNNTIIPGLAPGANSQSFLYSNGHMTSVTPVGGGTAMAINDSGEVVGGVNVGVNNSGQIVGSPFQVPFTSTAGTMTTTQASFNPVGINDAGQIAGTIFRPGGGTDAAIYQNGQVFDIGKALGLFGVQTQTVAMGIDRAGDVLFSVFNGNNNTNTYMIYKADGSTQTLTGGGPPSGMNNLGQVVGNNSFGYGFLFSNGSYVSLGSLLPPNTVSLWQFLDPSAINDEGEIVGTGQINGQVHAFLMTPNATPEPSTLVLLATAIGTYSVREWFRRSRQG